MEQDRAVQGRVIEEARGGKAERNLKPTSLDRRGTSSKPLTQRAMKSRDTGLHQRAHAKGAKVDELISFFSRRPSNHRIFVDDRYSGRSTVNFAYGDGGGVLSLCSRAPGSTDREINHDLQASQTHTGNIENPGDRVPSSVHERQRQNTRIYALPSQRHVDARSASCVTWSTSHHGEFLDNTVRKLRQERGSPRNVNSPPAQRDMQIRSSSNLKTHGRNSKHHKKTAWI